MLITACGFLRVSKKSLLSLSESGDFGIESRKKREKEMEKGVIPTPFCQLFQVHGSIFKPHPACDPGQTSMMRVTHRMFFFCIGKDTFNRLLAQGIDFFPSLCSPQLLYKVQILLPDMFGQELLSFFICSTHSLERAGLTMLRVATVSPFSFPVCSGMSQRSAVPAGKTILFGIVFILPGLVYVPSEMVVCIRKNGDPPIIQCFLGNPWGFVPRIHCYEFCFRKSLRYLSI